MMKKRINQLILSLLNKKLDPYNDENAIDFKWSDVQVDECCSYSIPPHTPGKGVYKPEKNWLNFSKNIPPLPPCNYFWENGFQKIVQLMNIWMSLLKF